MSIASLHPAAVRCPTVPLEHCKRLDAAYSAAQVWITSTPADQLPPNAGPTWGTHAKSYLLNPDEYVQQVTGLLGRVFVED